MNILPYDQAPHEHSKVVPLVLYVELESGLRRMTQGVISVMGSAVHDLVH